MPEPDLWRAPEHPRPSLRLLPRPQRIRSRPRRSQQRQQPIALVDQLMPDLDTQLCSIARELRRFDL